MLKIALCDDEVYYIEIVKDLLRSYSIEKDIHISIEAFNCGESLLDSKEEFGVFFLDIAMEGINGIETARIIRHNDDLVPDVPGSVVTVYSPGRMSSPTVHVSAPSVTGSSGSSKTRGSVPNSTSFESVS